MREKIRYSRNIVLLMLLLPLTVVLVVAGCQQNKDELYRFVATSVTGVTSEESSVCVTSIATESAAISESTVEETTTEETEESEETTTKAEVKAETKKTTRATTKATTKAVKKTSKSTKKKSSKPKYTSYLFVGDSRTVGLDNCVSGISSIAKVGAGLSYLKSVLPEVTKVRGKNVIFNFGVNDLGNYKKYAKVYRSLPKEFLQKNNVIFMSVNPCSGSKYGSWNSKINTFNSYVKKNLPSGMKYLDTCSKLKSSGFKTRDGCHYLDSTYRKIAKYVFEFCGEKNRKY